jgi:hypothetical protein
VSHATLAHLFQRSIQQHTRAEFVNIIEETSARAAARDEDYLLISSSTTRKYGLYHDELCHRGVRFCEVSETDQATIDRIVDLVMAFRLDDAGALISRFSPVTPGIITTRASLPAAPNCPLRLTTLRPYPPARSSSPTVRWPTRWSTPASKSSASRPQQLPYVLRSGDGRPSAGERRRPRPR